MSAKQRMEAEALRNKYARVFDVDKEDIQIDYLEDEDAKVYHKTNNRLPRWSLGTTDRTPLRANLGEWNAKTDSKFRSR